MKKLKLPKNFEKKQATANRQEKLIKQLRKSNSSQAADLANLLDSCLNDEKQCNSGACLKCSRRLRKEFLSEILPHMEKAQEIHMLTMVLSEFSVKRHKLKKLGLKAIKERYQSLLRKHLPKNLMIIGGIDISLNSFENKNYYWQVHIHALVLKMASGASIVDPKVKKKLRGAIKNSPDIKRPLKVNPVSPKEKASVVTYCLKSNFEWRSGYLKTTNLGEREPHPVTRGIDLKNNDEVELRLWLTQGTMVQRLILVGASNPVSPNNIQLRPTSRIAEMSEKTKLPKLRQGRVTRSKKDKPRNGRKRIKRTR